MTFFTAVFLALVTIAPTGPDATMLQPVHRWIDAYNSGKAPLPEDIFTQDVVISDEFPPFVWTGSAGEHQWAQAIDAYIRPGQEHVSIGSPQSFRQTRDGSSVEFVLPATLSYVSSRTGKRIGEQALWLFVLSRSGNAWKIAADTWTPNVPADPPVSLRIRNEGGVLLVPATVDGAGPLLFMFDPGANDLYTSYARERLNGRAPRIICVSGACYSATMGYFGGDPAQLDPQHASSGGTIAGSLGPELLRHYVARIDYRSSTLTLIAPEDFRPPRSATPIALRLDSYGLPVAPASVDGIPGLFEIDVRAPSSMLFRPFLERAGLGRRYAKTPVVRRSGMRVAHAVRSVRLQGVTVRSVPFWFSADTSGKFASGEVAGLLGNDVLSHFELTFDFPHRSVYVRKL